MVFVHGTAELKVENLKGFLLLLLTDGSEKNNIQTWVQAFAPVDLHRSKSLISLVPFNQHFHCFQE